MSDAMAVDPSEIIAETVGDGDEDLYSRLKELERERDHLVLTVR